MTIHENAGTDFQPYETDGAGALIPRRTDDKGRVVPEDMSVPEMMREILANQREVKDMVGAFMADFQNNPMLKMMGKLSR